MAFSRILVTVGHTPASELQTLSSMHKRINVASLRLLSLQKVCLQGWPLADFWGLGSQRVSGQQWTGKRAHCV